MSDPTSKGGPDPGAAREKYRRVAGGYDRIGRISAPLRSRAVSRLGLRPGDTVLDIGCGTGLTFHLLEARIGQRGRLVGIDLSPEMLDRARERVA
jgi:ubiquinone/menaquinone biosynthesis C-methylase UbiE